MKVVLTNEELETAIDDYLHKIMVNSYNLKSELDLFVITRDSSGNEIHIDSLAVYNVEVE